MSEGAFVYVCLQPNSFFLWLDWGRIRRKRKKTRVVGVVEVDVVYVFSLSIPLVQPDE